MVISLSDKKFDLICYHEILTLEILIVPECGNSRLCLRWWKTSRDFPMGRHLCAENIGLKFTSDAEAARP